MEKPKVSILSPCYNVGKYIAVFLDSVLSQDYNSLEIILVDDGSTDNTAEIIQSYRKIFEEKGVQFRYEYKTNGGVASAMALGLPLVRGEYLIWPDSDDFLLDGSIRKLVAYMDGHPECGIVRGNGYTYEEADLSHPIGQISKRWGRDATLRDFVKFVVPWCPGCYMVRVSALDQVNPERKIYLSPCGQNIQMLLPIVSAYPCHYLHKYLYGYVIHGTSLSHQKRDYQYASRHIDDMRECVIQTLNLLEGDYTESMLVHDSFIRKVHYETAWRYKESAEMNRYERLLREHNEYYLEYRLMKLLNPDSCVKSVPRYVGAVRRRLAKEKTI